MQPTTFTAHNPFCAKYYTVRMFVFQGRKCVCKHFARKDFRRFFTPTCEHFIRVMMPVVMTMVVSTATFVMFMVMFVMMFMVVSTATFIMFVVMFVMASTFAMFIMFVMMFVVVVVLVKMFTWFMVLSIMFIKFFYPTSC